MTTWTHETDFNADHSQLEMFVRPEVLDNIPPEFVYHSNDHKRAFAKSGRSHMLHFYKVMDRPFCWIQSERLNDDESPWMCIESLDLNWSGCNLWSCHDVAARFADHRYVLLTKDHRGFEISVYSSESYDDVEGLASFLTSKQFKGQYRIGKKNRSNWRITDANKRIIGNYWDLKVAAGVAIAASQESESIIEILRDGTVRYRLRQGEIISE